MKSFGGEWLYSKDVCYTRINCCKTSTSVYAHSTRTSNHIQVELKTQPIKGRATSRFQHVQRVLQTAFFLSFCFFVTRCSSCCFKISVDAHVKHVRNNFKLNPCSVPTVVVISICCVRFSTGELKGGILLHGLCLLSPLDYISIL